MLRRGQPMRRCLPSTTAFGVDVGAWSSNAIGKRSTPALKRRSATNKTSSSKRKFKRHYEKGIITEPDWRITCFFVDRNYRGQGIANIALDAALDTIAEEGGGLVEAYPEITEGRTVKGTFIYLGTMAMFERRGFEKQRPVSMHNWVVTKQVEPRSKSA